MRRPDVSDAYFGSAQDGFRRPATLKAGASPEVSGSLVPAPSLPIPQLPHAIALQWLCARGVKIESRRRIENRPFNFTPIQPEKREKVLVGVKTSLRGDEDRRRSKNQKICTSIIDIAAAAAPQQCKEKI